MINSNFLMVTFRFFLLVKPEYFVLRFPTVGGRSSRTCNASLTSALASAALASSAISWREVWGALRYGSNNIQGWYIYIYIYISIYTYIYISIYLYIYISIYLYIIISLYIYICIIYIYIFNICTIYVYRTSSWGEQQTRPRGTTSGISKRRRPCLPPSSSWCPVAIPGDCRFHISSVAKGGPQCYKMLPSGKLLHFTSFYYGKSKNYSEG